MKVYLNGVTGLADAIESMYMSKRTWTPELGAEIQQKYGQMTFNRFMDSADMIRDDETVQKLFKWGVKHYTMLRFIDISFLVEGLHRGAQDDFDSHAKRLDNRIIRSSTRLAKYGDSEKSDYYKDKILTTDEVCQLNNIVLPQEYISDNGVRYVKVTNGYVKEEYADNKDVLRGLYMLSIPSNFIFKCNVTEYAHIVKERDKNSHAAPELQEMIELTLVELQKVFPQLTREMLYSIQN